MLLAIILLAATGLVQHVKAGVDCDSGGTVVINYEVAGDVTVDCAVANVPGTNLIIEDGANISHDVMACNNGRIFMSGGAVGNRVCGYGNSRLLITGGDMLHEISAFNDSRITFTGNAQVGFAMASDQGTLQITGGTVGNIEAYGDSNIYLSGGSGIRGLMVIENGMMTISGSDFRMGGVSVAGQLDIHYLVSIGAMWDMSLPPYGEYYGNLTGILDDGTPLDALVEILHRPGIDGQFMGGANVILVPEPTIFLFMATGSIILRRKQFGSC